MTIGGSLWVSPILIPRIETGSPRGRLPSWDDETTADAIVDAMEQDYESCSLDLVARHPDGMTLEKIANVFGLTRERVRQIEEKAMVRSADRIKDSEYDIKPHEVETATCIRCGEIYPRQIAGRKSKYCTKRCYMTAYNDRKRAKRKAEKQCG
jgi:hypothetical protein